jgi:F-type H+-transporting ATPase subunit epsilon
MAGSFKFELVSPERLLMSEDVEQVVVPGSEGQYTVLAGHAPVLSTLKPGVVDIMGGGQERRIYVRGGFADTDPESLTILAEYAVNLDELDAEHLAEEIRNGEEDAADAFGDAAKAKTQERLDQLRELEQALFS